MKRKTLPELCDDSLDFSAICWNVVESSPIVGFQRQVSQRQESKDGPASIANDHIENPVVPPEMRQLDQILNLLFKPSISLPALGKVGQLVLQRVFQEFKHHRDHCGQPPIPK